MTLQDLLDRLSTIAREHPECLTHELCIETQQFKRKSVYLRVHSVSSTELYIREDGSGTRDDAKRPYLEIRSEKLKSPRTVASVPLGAAPFAGIKEAQS